MLVRFMMLLALAFSPLAHGSGAADLLISLLNNIESLSASYEQAGQATSQRGQFWLSRPDRFRLTAVAPVSQIIVSDGENLWTHDLDLEQVIITRLSDEAANIPLLLFAGHPAKLKDTYNIEQFEDENLQHFVLSPLDKTSAIGIVVLSFANNLPLRLAFQTAMQQRTVIHFHNVSAAPVDAALFDFQLPDNIDVIDDRPGSD